MKVFTLEGEVLLMSTMVVPRYCGVVATIKASQNCQSVSPNCLLITSPTLFYYFNIIVFLMCDKPLLCCLFLVV